MPLYEYECGACGRFEIIQKFSDSPLEACPKCGEPVQKLLSPPAIQFKGSGWYVTDYAAKSTKPADKGKAGTSSESGSSDSSSSTPNVSNSKDSAAKKQ